MNNKKITYIIDLNEYVINNDFKILKEIINEINNSDQDFIFLQKLIINKKQEINKQLEKLKFQKQEIENNLNVNKIINNQKEEIKNNLKFAVQIKLENYDNSNISLINNLKQNYKILIGLGGLNKQNRFFLEQTQIDFLQDPQNSYFKPKIDFIHHFNSGINQVLSTFAKEKEIGFLFTLNFTQNNNKYLIAKEIGRINQNIKFARKYNIPIHINYLITNKFQIKEKQQLESISSLFEISTKQKLDNKYEITKKILKNKKKQDKNYISKYIQIIE